MHYRCMATQGEFFASVAQIDTWIKDGPLLLPPKDDPVRYSEAPVTYPCYFPKRAPEVAVPASPYAALHTQPSEPPAHSHLDTPTVMPSTSLEDPADPLRRSQRKRQPPDFSKPTFKGKVYTAQAGSHLTKKQRVPIEWVYLGKERVSIPEAKIRRLMQMHDKASVPAQYHESFRRYRQQLRHKRNERVGWWDLSPLEADPDAVAHTATVSVNQSGVVGLAQAQCGRERLREIR